jgi:predicted Fe-Mo cluster-binding NifX family protein
VERLVDGTSGEVIMKIAVSSKGMSADSDVDPRFGRSTGFVLLDTETEESGYLDNSARRTLSTGTGVQTAKRIVENGTEVLITGQMGPKAARVLKKSGVKIYGCTGGTVREAVRALEQKQLKELGDDAIRPGPGKMGGRGMGGGGRGRGG